MITMFDSTYPSGIPHGPEAVAGYVDGYVDFGAMVTDFPHAYHKSIAIFAAHDADIFDIERGAGSPGEAPGWFHRQKARGVSKPALYSAISDMPGIIQVVSSAGIPRAEYHVWTAHVGVGPHICAPGTCGYAGSSTPIADATQWLFTQGYDESLCEDRFFNAGPPPLPPDPYHYLWFPTKPGKNVHGLTGGPFHLGGDWLDERRTVTKYDGARKHPHCCAGYLRVLEGRLELLAGRVWEVAHEQRQHGWIPWNDNRRFGWRFQQLHARAHGKQFVK